MPPSKQQLDYAQPFTKADWEALHRDPDVPFLVSVTFRGFAAPEYLSQVARLKWEKLRWVGLYDWPTGKTTGLDKFPQLDNISLSVTQAATVVTSPVLNEILVTMPLATQSVDLTGAPAENVTLQSGVFDSDETVQASIRLPRGVKRLTLQSVQLQGIDPATAPPKITTTLRGTKFRFEQTPVFPTVTTLEVNNEIEIEALPRVLPNLQELTLVRPTPALLAKTLAAFRKLQKVQISVGNEEGARVLTEIHASKPAFALTGYRNDTGTLETFENGCWNASYEGK